MSVFEKKDDKRRELIYNHVVLNNGELEDRLRGQIADPLNLDG